MSAKQKLYKNKMVLKTASDARKYVSRIANRFDFGEISSNEARTLCYIIRTLLKTIEYEDFQTRLDELEKVLDR